MIVRIFKVLLQKVERLLFWGNLFHKIMRGGKNE